MIDLKTFLSAMSQIEEEKGISREKIIETIELALAAAYKKDYGERGQIVRAKMDTESGSFTLWQEKLVVDESMLKSEDEIAKEQEDGEARVEEEEEEGEDGAPKKVRFNEERHIMVEDAQAIKKGAKAGDILTFDLEYKDEFGRIAAQTAKQVIIQKIREAEREAVFGEYENKTESIISGIVQRVEGGYIFFDIGKTTGIMMPQDRIPGEHYRIGARMRLYLVAVDQGARGPQIVVSRSHPSMLVKLFELEVPEIGAGSVEIKALAREAGSRSKIAVTSHEEGVDPIGSCVGQRGTRVAAVIQELGGEKIDIIEWRQDPAEFVGNALSPASVQNVELEEDRARVTVASDQLSLAIGRDGQNVRLAAKLTGYKIDIVSKETGEVEETSEVVEGEEPEAEKDDSKEESAEEVTEVAPEEGVDSEESVTEVSEEKSKES